MMFRQVLDNLIDNAIRYRGEEAPNVELRLARVEDWAELRVTDQGMGVEAQELPHLFDRFYRSENHGPRRKRKGTGIGLFVVRSIVEAHGGRVKALSDGPGLGTMISIRLPMPDKTAESAIDKAAQKVARLTSNVLVEH